MGRISLYDDDIVTWSDQQVAALRRIAARPELSNAVDWSNVIEEIECLGRSEWKGVESQIRNALVHILKGYCDPASLSGQAWAVKTDRFLDDARTDFRESMRQQIDMERAWQRAFRNAVDELRRYRVRIPPGIPRQSPFGLDDMLSQDFSYETGVQALYRLKDQLPEAEGTT